MNTLQNRETKIPRNINQEKTKSVNNPVSLLYYLSCTFVLAV